METGSVITIEVREEQLLTGLIIDGRLVEYHVFSLQEEALIDSIVMGKVTDPVGGLHSFVINLRKEKSGFLNAGGGSAIRCGDERPFQILQEGAGEKGYRVTDRYTLAGHNLVLTPFDPRTSISSKVGTESLKTRFNALREGFPGGGSVGWIFRTDAEAASDTEILTEADSLYARYTSICDRQKTAVIGTVLDSPPLPIIDYILSQPKGSLAKVVCDDKATVRALNGLLPEPAVEFFDQGRWSIREFYRLTGQLMEAMSRKVLLRDGGSIVIDETEALVAIDVNSGSTAYGRDRDRTIFEANKKAAAEILHQIRLRNLSGILIIDFIDMRSEADREKLLHLVREGAKKDRLKVTVHDYTALGLMELTRRRERLPLSAVLTKESI